MAAVLNEPSEPWWQEILDHLPPIATGAPDSIGGGLYWEQASNGLHPDDSLYALFPAETADVLGRYLLRGIYANASEIQTEWSPCSERSFER
jgi:hypothetical protein